MTLQVLYSSSSQAPCSGQELTTASLEPCPGMGTAKGVFGAQRRYKELCLSQCCFYWDKWETLVLQDKPYGCIHKSERVCPQLWLLTGLSCFVPFMLVWMYLGTVL